MKLDLNNVETVPNKLNDLQWYGIDTNPDHLHIILLLLTHFLAPQDNIDGIEVASNSVYFRAHQQDEFGTNLGHLG